jgi:UDP-glucose 4-epimerase
VSVLLAGEAGYIGSHTAVALLAVSYHVFIYDNLSYSKRDVMFRIEKITGKNVLFPLEYFDNNVYGTISLIKAMSVNNVKTLVFSSSAAVYGEPQYLPID